MTREQLLVLDSMSLQNLLNQLWLFSVEFSNLQNPIKTLNQQYGHLFFYQRILLYFESLQLQGLIPMSTQALFLPYWRLSIEGDPLKTPLVAHIQLIEAEVGQLQIHKVLLIRIYWNKDIPSINFFLCSIRNFIELPNQGLQKLMEEKNEQAPQTTTRNLIITYDTFFIQIKSGICLWIHHECFRHYRIKK